MGTAEMMQRAQAQSTELTAISQELVGLVAAQEARGDEELAKGSRALLNVTHHTTLTHNSIILALAKTLLREAELRVEKAKNLGIAATQMLAALEFIVNDAPEGEDAQLTVEGYNMACAAIAASKRGDTDAGDNQ